VLLEEFAADGKGAAHHYLLKLDRAANRLEALTRDLLQFSTVSRQDVRLERTEIGEILQDIRLLRPALHEEVLEVKQPLEPVLAQHTLLQQCLSNLLDNALKFTPPGKMPHIVVWTEKTGSGNSSSGEAFKSTPQVPYFSGDDISQQLDGNSKSSAPRVRIWVEDNGIGVAPESSKKIFGIFERLNPADKYEGTGIGLAIVARAAQRMGGACGVEPGPQSGSRFWLELRPASETSA
jgi:signal transduction histidine kinase